MPGAGDEGGGSSCCDYVASDFVSLAAQLGRPSHPPRREQAFLLALPDGRAARWRVEGGPRGEAFLVLLFTCEIAWRDEVPTKRRVGDAWEFVAIAPIIDLKIR